MNSICLQVLISYDTSIYLHIYNILFLTAHNDLGHVRIDVRVVNNLWDWHDVGLTAGSANHHCMKPTRVYRSLYKSQPTQLSQFPSSLPLVLPPLTSSTTFINFLIKSFPIPQHDVPTFFSKYSFFFCKSPTLIQCTATNSIFLQDCSVVIHFYSSPRRQLKLKFQNLRSFQAFEANKLV